MKLLKNQISMPSCRVEQLQLLDQNAQNAQIATGQKIVSKIATAQIKKIKSLEHVQQFG
jgi:hypothetical protein